MNKYYIGYSLPEELREKIRNLHLHIIGTTAIVDVNQLHITAMHIGPMPRVHAESLFLGLMRRTLPISCTLDTYARFGDHIVILLQKNKELSEINQELRGIRATMEGNFSGKSFDYNPHITLAHGKNVFVRTACPEGSFLLKHISLFEKVPGGEYGPHLTTEFR